MSRTAKKGVKAAPKKTGRKPRKNGAEVIPTGAPQGNGKPYFVFNLSFAENADSDYLPRQVFQAKAYNNALGMIGARFGEQVINIEFIKKFNSLDEIFAEIK